MNIEDQIKEEVKKIIRDSLTIEIKRELAAYHFLKFDQNIRVKILLDGEVISESRVTLYDKVKL